MADKKTDAVGRVMDSVDAFGSKIDQLAGKLAALAEKMGPDAKLVFDETLHAYALKGLLGLIVMGVTAAAGVGFGIWAMIKAEKLLKKIKETNSVLSGKDKVNDDSAGCFFLAGIVSTIIGILAAVVMVFCAADLFTRWMYPLGSLILEKL